MPAADGYAGPGSAGNTQYDLMSQGALSALSSELSGYRFQRNLQGPQNNDRDYPNVYVDL